ncbi:hypothetical protein DL767_004866 [Monosporascus sp. MG133]|nr:hypothetical protein DL767_004866 [Monosporascus sp. MG133]
MALRTLDFAKFLNGSESERRELARDLTDSFKQHGFAKLINHGIEDQQIADLFKWTSRLFALPLKEKAAIANVVRNAPQRGWSGQGGETTAYLREGYLKNGSKPGLTDEKEHFDCSFRDDTEFPNLWPSESALPGFRPFTEQAYEDLQNLSLCVIHALEIGLSLPPGTLVERCKETTSELRLNHYPPVSMSKLREGKTKRGWPHADFGIITLVFQDHVGGLEMEDRSRPGTFVPVPPGPPGGKTELAINISETFQRWSNDVLKAGIHQVAPPPYMHDMEDGIVPERRSIVFFFKASRGTSVGPLPAFVQDDYPARYEEMTALDFQKARTSVLYSIKA